MAKEGRKYIVVSVFENTIWYRKGVLSAWPWLKWKIRASLNYPPFYEVIIWSQEIEKANYTEKCHLPIIKEGRAIWRLKLNWNKKPWAHSKKMLNYWCPQSKKEVAISTIEKVLEAPQGIRNFESSRYCVLCLSEILNTLLCSCGYCKFQIPPCVYRGIRKFSSPFFYGGTSREKKSFGLLCVAQTFQWSLSKQGEVYLDEFCDPLQTGKRSFRVLIFFYFRLLNI